MFANAHQNVDADGLVKCVRINHFIGNWYNGSTDALGAPGGGSIPSFPTILK